MAALLLKTIKKISSLIAIIVIVATLFVALDINHLAVSNNDMANAYAGSGNWRNTIMTPGTYWLNNYCRNADWYTGWSSGGSGDYENTDTTLYINQGGSTGDRWGIHRVRLYYGADLTYAVSNQSYTYRFEADVHAANPDYNYITYTLRYYNGSTNVRTVSWRVWGDTSRTAPDQGKGSTDSATYRYIQDTVNSLAHNSIEIEIKTNKDSGWANPRHMDLYARNMRMQINANTSYYNAGFVSHGGGGFTGTGEYNVYYQNQGTLHGTSVSAIAGQAWCPTMVNSHTGGSGGGPYTPSVNPILSQSGSAPLMNDVTVVPVAYNNGDHTPSGVAVVAPSIGAVAVGNIPVPPIIDGLPLITTVDIDRTDTRNYQSTSNAAAATGLNNLQLESFGAMMPVDAYRWKNPVSLNPSLGNAANINIREGDGFLWAFPWIEYNVNSSGTIDRNLSRGDGWGGASAEVVVKFHTNGNDMHIVFAPGRTISWYADKDSRIEIVGSGRVFFYLMGNNTLDISGDGWWHDGNYIGTKNRETNPRMFFIAIGGNNYINFHRIRSRCVVYMPNGKTAPQYPGENRLTIETNDSNHEINGIAVSDRINFSGTGNYKFYKGGFPTTIHFNGQDRALNYFMDAPETPLAGYKWSHTGYQYG